MKKKLICALMTAAMAGSLVSGLTVSADPDSQVTISLYTTLPNKDSQFEQLCEEFMEENPDIKVNYIAYDSSEKQKWMTLYASGEAPTVSIWTPSIFRKISKIWQPMIWMRIPGSPIR